MSERPANLWHVGLPRNSRFLGRENLLADLHNRLHHPNLFDHTQIVYGPAGIGKTEFALEFAYRHRNEYDVIAWIRAGDQSTREKKLTKLAITLGFAPADAFPARAMKELRLGLATTKHWLMILDGLPHRENLAGLLPRTPGGHVIVTSRASDWFRIAPQFPLPPLTRDESIGFLAIRETQPESPILLSKLAKALGDHPGALEQAANVVEGEGITFFQYVRWLEDAWGDLLARHTRPPTNYPDAVAMSFEVLFVRLAENSRAAGELINLIAHFGDEPIPISLLTAGEKCVVEPLASTLRDPAKLAAAIEELEHFRVIDRTDDGSIRIASILRAPARDRLDPQLRKNWATMALNTAAAAFVFDASDIRTWSACDVVLPHALASAEHATAQDVGGDTIASLLNSAGQCLYRRAQYTRAKEVIERSLVLGYKVYGETNPRLSAITNNLARVLLKLGDVNDAKAKFEWALALDERAYGPAHPHVAEILNNLAISLVLSERPDKARAHLDRAMSIAKSHYGPQHESVASVLNNLGYVLMRAGELDEASERLNRSLSIFESTLGPAHPDVASVLNHLGDLARMQKDWPTAEAHYERALSISRTVHGPHHPDVARDLCDLGRVMLETNRASVAKQHFERALAIDEATFGRDHHKIAVRLEELGKALKALDDVDGAVRCADRVRKIERFSIRI